MRVTGARVRDLGPVGIGFAAVVVVALGPVGVESVSQGVFPGVDKATGDEKDDMMLLIADGRGCGADILLSLLSRIDELLLII